MVRVGRYTAALVVLATGIALLMDLLNGSELLLAGLEYWPVLLIALGLEYVIAGIRARSGEPKVKLDFGPLILAVVIALAVSGFSHGKAFLDKIDAPYQIPFGWGPQVEYEKPVQRVPLRDGTDKIVIHNPVGDVSVIAGSGDQVEIRPVVLVRRQLGPEEAEQIVRDSEVKVTKGSTMLIEAEGGEYRNYILFTHKAAVRLVVVIPEDRAVDVEVETASGDIRMDGIAVRDSWTLDTNNGDIEVANLSGEGTAETMNGDVKAERVKGPVRMSTLNGDIRVQNADGDVNVKTANGDITIESVSGNLAAETNNGDVEIMESLGGLQVETANGEIDISASRVGGDWTVETKHGDIEIRLPEDGDYRVNAESRNGGASTDISGLAEERNGIQGTVGSGEYRIGISGGKVDIRAYE